MIFNDFEGWFVKRWLLLIEVKKIGLGRYENEHIVLAAPAENKTRGFCCDKSADYEEGRTEKINGYIKVTI